MLKLENPTLGFPIVLRIKRLFKYINLIKRRKRERNMRENPTKI